MSLIIELHSPSGWTTLGTLHPGDQGGSMSNNKPDGTRDVIHFFCADDGTCTVAKSELGLDTEVGANRVTIPMAGMKVLATITKDKPYSMTVWPDKFKAHGAPRQLIRWRRQ